MLTAYLRCVPNKLAHVLSPRFWLSNSWEASAAHLYIIKFKNACVCVWCGVYVCWCVGNTYKYTYILYKRDQLAGVMFWHVQAQLFHQCLITIQGCCVDLNHVRFISRIHLGKLDDDDDDDDDVLTWRSKLYLTVNYFCVGWRDIISVALVSGIILFIDNIVKLILLTQCWCSPCFKGKLFCR